MTPEQKKFIEWECRRLALRFTWLSDHQDWAGACRLLTDNAEFARPTDPGNPLVGRQAIQGAFEARPAERITRHICTNVLIEVTSDSTATGSLYALLYTGNVADRAEPIVADARQPVGEFNDEYVRIESGWRIAARRGKIIFSTT